MAANHVTSAKRGQSDYGLVSLIMKSCGWCHGHYYSRVGQYWRHLAVIINGSPLPAYLALRRFERAILRRSLAIKLTQWVVSSSSVCWTSMPVRCLQLTQTARWFVETRVMADNRQKIETRQDSIPVLLGCFVFISVFYVLLRIIILNFCLSSYTSSMYWSVFFLLSD